MHVRSHRCNPRRGRIHPGRAHAVGWRRPPQAGFALLALLLIVALSGLALASAAQVWSTASRRDKEVELLRMGMEFRDAIRSYVISSPGAQQFPTRLEDLLLDPRFPSVKRHLRRIYADPLTGVPDWGLIRSGDAIIGVHSLAEGRPLKTALDPKLGIADEAATYADWKFVYQPEADAGAAPGIVDDHAHTSGEPDTHPDPPPDMLHTEH